MDICSYVNSRHIRDYLRKIEYEFNSKEAEWLINQCNSISVNEKHAAWQQLMYEMPDFDLGERFDYLPGNSLHELIRRNIISDEKSLQLLEKKEEGAVYHYKFYCFGDYSWCEDYEGIYASLEECWKEIEKDIELDIEVIDIKKRYISTNRTIEARYTPDRTLMDIYSDFEVGEGKEKIEDSFNEMRFDFPVPFEKGDILVPVYTPGPSHLWAENGPVVIENITPWQKELNERIQNATHSIIGNMVSGRTLRHSELKKIIKNYNRKEKDIKISSESYKKADFPREGIYTFIHAKTMEYNYKY